MSYYHLVTNPDGSMRTERLPDDAEARAAAVARIMDDCPECQAARARGEVPVTFDTSQLEAAVGLPRAMRRRIVRAQLKAHRAAERAARRARPHEHEPS